jgi:hypothetical protein
MRGKDKNMLNILLRSASASKQVTYKDNQQPHAL